jgi:pimeloyl-ACP methyl ester carboxylesterase
MQPQPTYVLIPGAASDSWYWHLVVPRLRDRGYDVVAVDLPCEDDSAGLAEYADAVVEAIGKHRDLVVVAHSFGGFTAPLVCGRVPVDLLVLVQAMIPTPGEPPGEWWTNNGYEDEVGADVSAFDTFFNDVAPDLAAEAMRREMAQSGTPMAAPWPLDAWPDVPTRFLLCSEDRFFPAPFMRRVVRERLGIVPDEIATGHLPMLARPDELADRLEGYALPGS